MSQDYLNIDPEFDETRDQKYACLSFLTPAKEDQTTLTGIKVRGVFSDYDEACKHAKRLQEVDPAFNVFVGEVGKWLPFDPDPDSKEVKSSEYANEELNDIMKNYVVNQEKAKVYHEKRKNEMARKNMEDNLRKTKNQYDSSKRKMDKTNGDMKKVLEKRLKKMEERMKEMNTKVEHLKEQEEKCLVEMKSIDKTKKEPEAPQPPRNVDLGLDKLEEKVEKVEKDDKKEEL